MLAIVRSPILVTMSPGRSPAWAAGPPGSRSRMRAPGTVPSWLASAGVTDFDQYAVTPGAPLVMDFFL